MLIEKDTSQPIKFSSNRPNVLIVITDDQGYGDLGCHGNPIIKTPNINKLHDESVRFSNFHVGPTCAPTRAGLLTGHYCNCTGVWHTILGRSLLRVNEITMADIFNTNGYKTGIFGKWHLGDNYPFRPQDRGFEVALYHGGGGVSQTPDYWGNDYFDDTYSRNGKLESFKGYCTDIWFDEAIKFIEENKNRPFFCYLATNAPHEPYIVAESYSNLYRGKVPDYRANFYGMITKIDDSIKKLRERLKTLGLEENTILIFLTDNGTSAGCSLNSKGFVEEGYNAGMRGMKAWEYEGGHRTPFFMYWPRGGLTVGRDINNLTANIDILPTLMDLCGLKPQKNVQFHGISLKPLIMKEIDKWPDRVIVTDSQRVEYPIKWRKSSVMTDRWRLINGEELYDIIADPGQKNDIAEKNPDLIKELRNHYEKWWELVSKSFDEDCPIVIDPKYEKVTRLTCHDWHGEDCAWNQERIRKGFECNGYWIVEFSKDGNYEFELQRWPREEARAIVEGIPSKIIDRFHGGKALNLKRARISIGDKEQSKEIGSNEKSIKFTFNLKSGITRLHTYFIDANDVSIGAYYVFIRLLK